MAEPKKVSNYYRVYDPVLNVARKFKKKADADEFVSSLANPPASANEETTKETNSSNGEN